MYSFLILDQQCYETIHKKFQIENNQFHIDCIDVTASDYHFPPQVDESLDQTTDSSLKTLLKNGFENKEEKNLPKTTKQHNGLRCKKCFELLVHDDEFL